MAGHVRERRPGSFELRVYVGKDPISGHQQWATRTVKAASKRAAERLLPAFAAEVYDGQIRTGDTTFGAVLDEWIDTKADVWSPATLREHRRIGRCYLDELRVLPVYQLRTIHLDRFYRRLRDAGGADGAKLDPATVRRIHVVVHAALEQARKWGLIARNPASDAEPGEADESEAVPPTVAELGALLRAAELIAPEFAIFLVVAAVTGARRGALCALRWTDLDVDAGIIRFPRVLSLGDQGVVERTASRKKRSARIAALDPITSIVLDDHRITMEKRAAALGVELDLDAFVFTDDPQGRVPWRPDDGASRRFARARRNAGLREDLRLHDLRHFMATFLLANGTDVRTIATRGGWGQASTLLDRYAHVLEPVDRRAANLLGDAIHT